MRLRICATLSLLAVISCDTPTALESPVVPDRAQLDRATVISIDLTAHDATGGANAHAMRVVSRQANSLLGRDVLDATIANVTRVSHNRRKDLVTFDFVVTNRLDGIELRPPSNAPVPPDGSASVFFFPYHVRVTGGSGEVRESADWDGLPFSFFNDLACRNGASSDCFPWEAVPAPLAPGATSPARRVGFLVDKGVTSFDVYLLAAADLVNVPTGSLEVTVTAAEYGPLPAVKVVSSTGAFAITDANGVATFEGIATGSHSIVLDALPASCTTPDAQSAAVVAAETATLAIAVDCVVPKGDATGTVTLRDVGIGAGVQIHLEPGGHVATAGADGSFSFSGLRSGLYAATTSGLPASCLAPAPLALIVTPTAPAALQFTVECPAPVVSVAAAAGVAFNTTATLNASASVSPAGAPLTFTWTQVAGEVAHEPGDGAVITYPTGERPGLYTWRVEVSDGLRSASREVEQFVMEQPGSAVFVSPLGDDSFEGTRARPMRSVQAAIDRAAPTAADLYVAAGLYESTAPIVLKGSISIYGRMNPRTWVHESPDASDASDAKRSVIVGPSRSIVSASGGTMGITLAYLTVRGQVMPGDSGTAIGISLVNGQLAKLRDNEIYAANGTGTAASSLALFIRGGTGITVLRNRITAGDGTRGADGVHGAVGRPGANAVTSVGAAPLYPNQNAGGNGGIGQSCSTGSVPTAGTAGDAPGGNPGAPGVNGPSGTQGAYGSQLSSEGFGVDGFTPVTDFAGGAGTHGGSGGGGGGGYKETSFLSCSSGASGGGGGTGGEGGLGGTSGQGGGASIAIYIASGEVSVTENVLVSGSGGDGGNAGLGGMGGPGGIGGSGGWNGGRGGSGGQGGRGGHGVRGDGGPSIGIARVAGPAQLTQSSNTFVLGLAGMSGANEDGARQRPASLPIR